MGENKVVDLKFADGKVILSVDPNKDGQPVFVASIDAAEVPDEIVSALKKKEA